MIEKKPCSRFGAGLPITERECFYGRHEQIERFFAEVRRPCCQPLRVLGLRRSGKTSYLFHLRNKTVIQEQLQGALFKVAIAYLDASASITTPSDFYLKVATSISQAMKDHSGWAEIEYPKVFPTAISFEQWIEQLISTDSELRLIVLIDEVEALCEKSRFPPEFWGFLRALVSRNGAQFSLVTATFVDLHQLGISNKAASDFWNIFHSEPIMIGPLESQGARTLVTDCAQHENMSLTKLEADTILQIAGPLPYFIQAVLEKWLNLRKKLISPDQCAQVVPNELLGPHNQIVKQFNWYWEHLNYRQRSFLSELVYKPSEARGKITEQELADYGIVARDNGVAQIAGELFRRWIADNLDLLTADTTLADSGLPKDQSHSNQSGGVTIQAGTVNITGDVTGRDKIETK